MLRHFAAIALSAMAILTLAASQARADDYSLTIGEKTVSMGGARHQAIAVNGQIPAPTLHFREGEDVAIHVTNRLATDSSIHWHGLRLPAAMDGVPGFNGFPGIKPGETFTYRFTVKQNGTYWYHAHSGLQEQAGLYGAIVIAPKTPDPVRYDRDYIVMLSDFPGDAPSRIFANLKADSDYYNYSKRTIGDFFNGVAQKGLGATLADRAAWGRMRMSPTDLSDVSAYTFLIDGKTAADNPNFLFKPGERVRLRFVNGASMTYFDVKIPGLRMNVVAADGQNVEPVPVDEFRISPAETYDVIVNPGEAKAFTIFAQSLDRTGYARATLSPHEGMSAPVPRLYPRALLSMSDMPGMDGMKTGSGNGTPAMQNMPGMDMKDMDMGGTAMPGMDMSGAKPAEKSTSSSSGWNSGYPPGEKVLSYNDLKALEPDADTRPPDREIVVHLGGNMQRYIWTMNGKKFDDAGPIELRYGERIKLTLVNDTMMAHPMHLHGMFVELLNGQSPPWLPRKHIVNVPPGKTVSVLFTADAPGEWAVHCHLLYHMMAGMMRKVTISRVTADAAP